MNSQFGGGRPNLKPSSMFTARHLNVVLSLRNHANTNISVLCVCSLYRTSIGVKKAYTHRITEPICHINGGPAWGKLTHMIWQYLKICSIQKWHERYHS